MKKKATARLNRSAAKHKKNKPVASQKSGGSKPLAAPPKRPSLMDDPRFAQAVQNYEAGLRAMQGRKFERAKGLLEKVATGPLKELADRATMHLNSCQQQLARTSSSAFKSPEEHYDYAISLMNAGQYDEARSHFEKLQRQVPKAEYVWYGMAVLDCLTHHYESALKNLEEAIKRDAANRFRARNEPDFQNLADDPRFTELLYPEGDTGASPEAVVTAKTPKRR